MKTLEDEQHVVKFTVFEIWRDFNVLSYIACPRYPYIRVYRLYDTNITIYLVMNLLLITVLLTLMFSTSVNNN